MASYADMSENDQLGMLLLSMGYPAEIGGKLYHPPRQPPSIDSTTQRSTCKPCQKAQSSTRECNEEIDMDYNEDNQEAVRIRERAMPQHAFGDLREGMRNAGLGDTTGPRPPEVADQITQLEKTAMEVLEASHMLVERLHPVMGPDASEKQQTPGPVDEGPQTEIGQTLYSVRGILNDARRKLNQATRRLEL